MNNDIYHTPSEAMRVLTERLNREERQFCRRALWAMIGIGALGIAGVIIGVLTA